MAKWLWWYWSSWSSVWLRGSPRLAASAKEGRKKGEGFRGTHWLLATLKPWHPPPAHPRVALNEALGKKRGMQLMEHKPFYFSDGKAEAQSASGACPELRHRGTWFSILDVPLVSPWLGFLAFLLCSSRSQGLSPPQRRLPEFAELSPDFFSITSPKTASLSGSLHEKLLRSSCSGFGALPWGFRVRWDFAF